MQTVSARSQIIVNDDAEVLNWICHGMGLQLLPHSASFVQPESIIYFVSENGYTVAVSKVPQWSYLLLVDLAV